MPRFVVVMTSHDQNSFSCITQPALTSSTSSQVVQAITTSKRYCVVTELDTKYNLMSSHTDKHLVSFVLLVPSSNYAAIGEHAG